MFNKKSIVASLIINMFLISCGSIKEAYKVGNISSKKETVKTVYNESAKLGYTISKNSTHLFVKLNTQERTTQMKMMQNGVTIYFDNEGKKNKGMFVQYPIAKERKTPNIDEIKKLKDNPQAMVGKRLEALGTDILIGENGERRVINKELNNEAISVDYQMSKNRLAYTLKIPLTYVESDTKNPSIGITIKGMQMQDMSNRPSGGMRGGGMKGGGMRGGGRPGGISGRSGGQGQKPDMTQIKAMQSDIEIWIPIEL